MGYDEIRVYGRLENLSPDAADLEDDFEFTEFAYDDGELDLEYEGNFFYLDDFIDRLEPCLTSHSKGRVDYIDQHAFRMTRFKVEAGQLQRLEVDLNNVLERYSRE
jgi:hypothetical protein